MSNKSGVSEQIISLPKGGGALQGIGETFSPDLYTGTGNFTIPITLPQGQNNFQPQLNLVYSTGNGNGYFGMGWALSIPGVSRKTSKGTPLYQSDDIFILSGAEDLVPVGQLTAAVVRYRPRTEGLFARIERTYNPARQDDYWRVRTKDGLVSTYGTPGRLGLADPAAIGRDGRNKFAWKLTETQNPFGNRILYRYGADAGAQGPHLWNQPRLDEITYAFFDDQGNQRPLVTVNLEYEERADPSSDYRPGFEVRTTSRCKAIIVETNFDRRRLVRSYQFSYSNQGANLASLLTTLQIVGYDDAGQAATEMPPLTFGYSEFDPIQASKRDLMAVSGPDLPPGSLARPEFELADLNGDGLPDILEMNGSVRYWRNLGNGGFDLPRIMQNVPAGISLADPDVQLIDANGNGRPDLLVSRNDISGYYPLGSDGEWDLSSFQRFQVAPSFGLEDPEVKLVDLDGDGLTDVIRSGTRLECFFNQPGQGWTPDNVRWVERSSLEDFPDVNFSDPRVKWGDMSGDDLQDILMVYDGNVEYWPNLGRGHWGRRVHMTNSPRFRDLGYAAGYDPRRILLGDIDGDGLDDIVYVGDREVTLWINQSGNRWSDPIVICGTPPVSDLDAVRLVDLLGSGVAGILWSKDAETDRHPHIFFLDLTGGTKPYLLTEMDNHMGAVRRVGYAPSTRYLVEDQRRRATRWKSSLPFPVHVVAQVEVVDQLSGGKLTSEFRYHHGYWDGAEREFRGFGMVERLDSERFDDYNGTGLHAPGFIDFSDVARQEFFSPPTLTRTWFHQGAAGPEFGDWSELDHSAEYWQGDPQLLDHTGQVNRYLGALRGRNTLFTRRMQRDALRSLRGSILRRELYALNAAANQSHIGPQDRPYSVTEHAYELVELPAPTAPDPDHPRIFFPQLVAQRVTQWEQGDDPMTQFTLTADYDAYGQPQISTTIACPRGWRTLAAAPAEGYLATRTYTEYAQRDDATHFMVDRVKRKRAYEFRQRDTRGKTVAQLRQTPNGDGTLLLFAQEVNSFDGLDRAQDYGSLGNYGAITSTETLALTEEILDDAYGNQRPPYLAPGLINWSPEYPIAFRQRVAALPGSAGYVLHDGIAAPHYHPGYYIRRRRRYDFQDNPAGARGLVVAEVDPLGNSTAITYDYQMLPVQTIDAAGLVTSATYNYRVMQPALVTDSNGNGIIVTFTHIGLPAAIAVLAKNREEQGDRRHEGVPPNGQATDYPSTQFEYNFRAFYNSPPAARQPAFVRTLKRQEHFWEIVRAENERRRDAGLPQLTTRQIDALFPATEVADYNERFIEVREYSDGFGRLLQTRTQGEEVRFGEAIYGNNVLPADPTDANGTRAVVVGRENRSLNAPNVIVSGWQSYDNKGRVVEKFEPFFDTGWDYTPPAQAYLDSAQKVQMFYDPLGRTIRTLNPDASEQRVIYGAPTDLATLDPAPVTPTPWETYTFDANDNAGRTNPADPRGRECEHHWNTPSSTVIDARGRTLLAYQRNRRRLANGDWSPIEAYRTTSTYDIRDNLLTLVDPLGREAFTYTYDLSNRALRNFSLDGGSRISFFDAAGNLIESRDSKGALQLSAYDGINRLTHLWARDDAGQPTTMRQRLIYGDSGNLPGLTRAQAFARNLHGRLYRHFDEAGLLQYERYDFKGNLLEKSRRTIRDSSIASRWVADWEMAGSQNALEPINQAYQTRTNFDALNRPTRVEYPANSATLQPSYNRSGALERVEVSGQIFVERIAYNAKGQRTLIVYGNGVMTRHAYDPQTFRLVRLRSERYTTPGALQYIPQPTQTLAQRRNNLLQEISYVYDLVGNMTTLVDGAPNSGLPATPDRLQRAFIYDPLYRLIQATGRECDAPPLPFGWDDPPRCSDPTRTRAYTESYTFDPAGNMLSLVHGGRWTRRFGMTGFTPQSWRNKVNAYLAGGTPNWGTGGNRLTNVGSDTQSQSHFYDANGNMIREGTSRRFTWNHDDQMIAFTDQANAGAPPSVEARYLYDAAGIRVKKWERTNGTGSGDSTVYINGIFEHQRWREAGQAAMQQNFLIHLMDNSSRVATIRVGDLHSRDAGPPVQYHLGDHLGSSSVVIGGATAQGNTFVNREDYYPYGETSFGSFGKKRYRFSGKERDERSGLYYHGARYYAPWLSRWLSCDPVGHIGGLSLFNFCHNNPVNRIDQTGLADEAKQDVNLVIGRYLDVGGHHPVQAAAYTCAPGAKDAFYQSMMAISQKTGDFTNAMHKDVNRAQNAINRAAWASVTGKEVNKTVGSGKLTVQTLSPAASRSNLDIGASAQRLEDFDIPGFGIKDKPAPVSGLTDSGTLPPTATPFFEEVKGYRALEAPGGKLQADAAKRAEVVMAASLEREAAKSVPKRVPGMPRFSGAGFLSKGTVAASLGLGIFFASQDAEAARESGDSFGEGVAWGQAIPGPVGTAASILYQGWNAIQAYSVYKDSETELEAKKTSAATFGVQTVPRGVNIIFELNGMSPVGSRPFFAY